MEVVGEQTKVAEEHVDTFAIGDRRCRRERVLWMNKNDKDVIFKQGLCLYSLSYFRDAKILEIGEGTSEIQRIIISREIIKSVKKFY